MGFMLLLAGGVLCLHGFTVLGIICIVVAIVG